MFDACELSFVEPRWAPPGLEPCYIVPHPTLRASIRATLRPVAFEAFTIQPRPPCRARSYSIIADLIPSTPDPIDSP
jgi:hypothetical protein